MKPIVGIVFSLYYVEYVITEVNETEGYLKIKPIDESLIDMLGTFFNAKFKINQFNELNEIGEIIIL